MNVGSLDFNDFDVIIGIESIHFIQSDKVSGGTICLELINDCLLELIVDALFADGFKGRFCEIFDVVNSGNLKIDWIVCWVLKH